MDFGKEQILLRILGKRIKSVRQLRKFSQEEVSIAIDKSRQSIIEIEYGKNSLSLKTLFRISLFLRIPIKNWFLSTREWNTFRESLNPKKVREEEHEVLSI